MYSKIEITGMIEVLTGMHIGGTDSFSAIGAIDAPVVKDPISHLPYIPGSSLKGKIRSLLAKSLDPDLAGKRDDDCELITRVFGTSRGKMDGNPKPSRVLFSDTQIANFDELKERGALSATEAKMENSINPLTAVANPRQIERVIRGAKFPLKIIYNVECEDEFLEDMKNLAYGMKLLEYDYLGGHGSRGYGKIKFENIKLACVIGEINKELLEQSQAYFEG